MPRLITLVLAVLVPLLCAPAAHADTLGDVGRNIRTSVGGALGELFLLAIAIAFGFAWSAGKYIKMVVLFFSGAVCAVFVLAPATASTLMKGIGMDFLAPGVLSLPLPPF